jgi:hypothetical protein
MQHARRHPIARRSDIGSEGKAASVGTHNATMRCKITAAKAAPALQEMQTYWTLSRHEFFMRNRTIHLVLQSQQAA